MRPATFWKFSPGWAFNSPPGLLPSGLSNAWAMWRMTGSSMYSTIRAHELFSK